MHLHNDWRRIAALSSLLAGVSLTACADAGPAPTTAHANAVAAPTQADLAKAMTVRHRMAWVGEAHHASMQVAIVEARQRKSAGRGRPPYGGHEYCNIMRRVGEAALDVVARHQKPRLIGEAREALLRLDPALASCGGVHVGNSQTARIHTNAAWRQSESDEVTGAYEAYVDRLESAALQSDGSVSAIRAKLDGVLAIAASDEVPTADLDALGGLAALIESSAAEWSNFDWTSTELSSCITEEGCLSVTSFYPQSRSKYWKVLGADVGGCLAAVKSWGALRLLLVTPAAEALAGYCGVRGAIASGVALFFT